MQSNSLPATRLEVMLWFLRVQMWLSVVRVVVTALASLVYFRPPVNSSLLWFRMVGVASVPLLLLLLFPNMLALNSLGQTARYPLTSLSDLRSLIGRCVGLLLFVQSLAEVVLYSGMMAYNVATGTPMGGSAMFPWYFWGEMVSPTLSFLLGFFLAFGPAIRDNFRSR